MTETVYRQTPRWRSIFEVVSTLVMLLLASALVWQGGQRYFDASSTRSAPLEVIVPSAPLDIGHSAARGAATAGVAMIEYADFECPACRQFAMEIEPVLRRDYVDTGQVLFVFKNLPLPAHPQAPALAQAAWCAGRQTRFWELHNLLFASAAKLSDLDLEAAVSRLGVHVPTYRACRNAGDAAKQIELERSEGIALKVPATPTFFFGRILPDGRVRASEAMVGTKSTVAFREILDRLLK